MSKYPLNKAQKEAVEYTSGPLLIVAGAGTGKTTVITNKIARLIEQKMARPEEILALTFTEKAAQEMQTRVDELAQVGYADMHISTFHSFCQRLLEHHAIDIGLSNSFKLLTETAGWILLHKNLDKLNLDYYRPLGNPTKHIHELLKHFSKLKDELITPAEYLKYAENDTKKSGALNLDDRTRITELANAYHSYNQLLLENSLMDFGDLLYYAVKLFSERPSILKDYQSRFKYILVDEFQDVNYAQYELIKLLADDRSQLTVVGDDDQSIYAFRGASVSNILRFKDDYPKAKEIVLSQNFRSGQAILDLAYASIQNNNPDRLEVKLKIDKKLVSQNTDKAQVIHLHSANASTEVKNVIDEIEKIKAADNNAVWDDFAILVRANSHADPFINELQIRGVPYEFLASSGLYRQPTVLDCLNYFKILTNINESSAVFRLLCMPCLSLKENDLQKITAGAKKKSITYYEALKRGSEFDLSQSGLAVCTALTDVIHAGLQAQRYEKPSTVLYSFLEKSGYLAYLTHQENQGNAEVIRQIRHLKQFLDYISQYEAITAGATVAGFTEHFLMVVDSGDKGSLYEPGDTPDSVNILTAHAAKGLEFKYVFVVNLVEDRFPSRARGEAIQIPDALVKEQLPEGDSHLQEERRLFYVALTRAKQRLYLTSANDYGGARVKKISRFLSELGYAVNRKTETSKIIIDPKPSKTAVKQTTPNIYETPKSFSFSQLRSYETCPYQYKLAHVLHIPMKGSANFSFGSSMHNTLQAFYERVKELNRASQTTLFDRKPKTKKTDTGVIVPSLDDLLKIYDSKWIGDWYKDKTQRESMYKKGKSILKIFYESQSGQWNIPLGLESWFKIKVGDYVINGRIDRLDQLPDKSIEIIDYKTGQSKETLTTDDKEQLLLYQIAVEEIAEFKAHGKPSKLTFYYLNDNIKTSFVGEPKDLDKLKTKLAATIERITKSDFTATPSQFVCNHCDFKDICQFRA